MLYSQLHGERLAQMRSYRHGKRLSLELVTRRQFFRREFRKGSIDRMKTKWSQKLFCRQFMAHSSSLVVVMSSESRALANRALSNFDSSNSTFNIQSTYFFVFDSLLYMLVCHLRYLLTNLQVELFSEQSRIIFSGLKREPSGAFTVQFNVTFRFSVSVVQFSLSTGFRSFLFLLSLVNITLKFLVLMKNREKMERKINIHRTFFHELKHFHILISYIYIILKFLFLFYLE